MIVRANHAWRVAGLAAALAHAIVQGAGAQSPPLTGTVETVSSSGTTYDYPAVSANGRHVAFVSELQLDPADVSPTWFDIYVRDRQLGTTVLVSKSSTGEAGNGRSARPSISADGRFVAFSSSASNLVPCRYQRCGRHLRARPRRRWQRRLRRARRNAAHTLTRVSVSSFAAAVQLRQRASVHQQHRPVRGVRLLRHQLDRGRRQDSRRAGHLRSRHGA